MSAFLSLFVFLFRPSSLCYPLSKKKKIRSDFQAPLINSLENVLHDVEGREKFRAFLERAFALENLFFYESVSEFVGLCPFSLAGINCPASHRGT